MINFTAPRKKTYRIVTIKAQITTVPKPTVSPPVPVTHLCQHSLTLAPRLNKGGSYVLVLLLYDLCALFRGQHFRFEKAGAP
ncbi:hypothetical protein Nepgr_018901 [Nepenthes gracilis]|uniref:Uncharacterized protein n=1 Tax=Nepenthes gracilis TaxID=150966 RepID=A0AAD3SSB8_NEPGR|nr:hypothetical protein Nepgr_018901 [Nepenthes gracilis]